ncbi:DUF5421 family protein [Chlamydia sp. 17-3921]|uniref:DUF5421 family protein n=1 Tax=Chlamydia sp. 17-3921 TaxID=2675798 RepID=UPI00191A1FBF|nr:DUF5421 family protein [Chlamydia sp. 17-3921]
MELNKTSESLYSCKTESRVSQDNVVPGPQDNREVKVFSLEGKQQSQEKTTTKTQSRSESRGTEDSRRLEEKTSSVASKEEETTDQEESQLLMGENAAAGLALVDLISASTVQEVQATSSTVSVASVDLEWVENIIMSTVESMMISEVDGQQFIELVLDSTNSVPEAFCGVNLTLMQSGDELSVKFSNFVDNAQASNAVELVSNNSVQLTSLVGALQARNLKLSQFVVGSQVVQLPKLEEIQTPLHMIAATIRQNEEKEQEREGKDQKQQDQEQHPYKVEEARL